MGTKNIIHIPLIVLDAFLAFTAVVGGIGLLTGAISPPLASLQGSPFSTYTIPALALLVLVGVCRERERVLEESSFDVGLVRLDVRDQLVEEIRVLG